MSAGQDAAVIDLTQTDAVSSTHLSFVPKNKFGQPVRTLGVVLCTYRRPDNLAKCLRGLEQQIRRPDEVVIVARDTDQATQAYVHGRSQEPLPVRLVTVTEPGLIAARTRGLAAATSDVLALTDDDAVPRPDWLDRIFAHFAANPQLGGLGGRDQCYTGGVAQLATKDLVGKLLWNGKHVGNHHLGRGSAREVDILKGANMSYRREALAAVGFDRRLRGSGSQACEDLAVSRAVGNQGWLLLYDPAVLVDHYEGARDEARHYAGQVVTDWNGFSDSVYNQVVAVWDSLSPARRLASLVYFAVLGTRAAPGLLQAIRFTPQLRSVAWVRFWVTQTARLAAYRNLLRGHGR